MKNVWCGFSMQSTSNRGSNSCEKSIRIVDTYTVKYLYIKSKLICTAHSMYLCTYVFTSFGIHFAVLQSTLFTVQCSLFLRHFPYGIKFFPFTPNLLPQTLAAIYPWENEIYLFYIVLFGDIV